MNKNEVMTVTIVIVHSHLLRAKFRSANSRVMYCGLLRIGVGGVSDGGRGKRGLGDRRGYQPTCDDSYTGVSRRGSLEEREYDVDDSESVRFGANLMRSISLLLMLW